MTQNTYDSRRGRPQWHWVMLGLAPGLASVAMFTIARLTMSNRDSEFLASIGGGMFWGGLLVPIAGVSI